MSSSEQGVPLHLDPALVDIPSLLRFRAPRSYTDPDFMRLKASIAHLGGNVQPIKVRCGAEGRYELVLGSRRLRGCLELGLPVTAVVDNVSGPRVVEELDASNDDSQVSVYERGCLYEAALNAGLFPSRRRLADALGRRLQEVADVLTVAQLPRQLLDRLPDPRVLKVSVAKRLAAAVARDPHGFDDRLSRAALNHSADLGFLIKELIRPPSA